MNSPPGILDFYFDFVSPFGYLASLEIDDLALRHGWQCRWNSMLVGVSVLKVMGMKPLPEIPLKGEYLQREIARHCRKKGVVLKHSPRAAPANPVWSGRAFNWTVRQAPELSKEYARAIFAAYWLNDRDIAAPATLGEIYKEVGGDGPELTAALESGVADALLRGAVTASIDRGVFGSPFFFANDEPFFGLDKLCIIEEWLSSGGW